MKVPSTVTIRRKLVDYTDDGRILIQLWLDIIEGKIKASVRDRLSASEMVWDRTYGKPVQTNVNFDADVSQHLDLPLDVLEKLASMKLPNELPAPMALPSNIDPDKKDE